jgi:elongation factor P
MKVLAHSLRPGHVIEYNGSIWQVQKSDTMQPGKGAAVTHIEMRDMKSGNKDNVRFRTQETLERLYLEQEYYQFLYADGEDYNFMHNETFEQITVPGDVIGYPAHFLQEGLSVLIETYEGMPLRVELPDTVTLEVTEAEPVVKGQTATASYKPATLENGVRIMVPPHIEMGQRVVVKAQDGTYVERAKD